MKNKYICQRNRKTYQRIQLGSRGEQCFHCAASLGLIYGKIREDGITHECLRCTSCHAPNRYTCDCEKEEVTA